MKKISYSKVTKGEGNALYLLRDDTSIIIKEADKGSVVMLLNREDYLREAKTNLVTKIYIEK